jgi:mRNA-degrading endonuclease toxin of MazEF toxin-antitoxin module
MHPHSCYYVRMSYIKNFRKWIGIKESIEKVSQEDVLHFSEREVWMCYFGENVGFESCGKNEHFHRPVLVLRKFGGYTFYAIPLSTKKKVDNKYYIEIELNNKKQSAMISQMRLLDVRRLHYRKGLVSESNFEKVKEGFLKLFSKT